MKRLLLVWLTLFTVLLVVTALFEFVVFKRIDLRFVALLQALLVPAFQAAVLLWVSGDWSAGALLEAAREARGRTAVLALLVVDLCVLAAGWVVSAQPQVSLAAVGSLQPRWAGIKALAAAAAAVVLALRAGRSAAARAWLGIFSVAALVLAAEPFRHRIRGLADLASWGTTPTVLRWLAVYGVAYVLAMVALVHTGTVLRARSRLGGFFADAAIMAGFLAGLVMVPNIFLKPYLVDPWTAVVHTCVSLAATFTLAAFLSALTERNDPVA